MSSSDYTGAPALARAAQRLARQAVHRSDKISPLMVLTDPVRLPDPVSLASQLPAGCTLVYRHFGAPDAARISAEAAAICAARGLVFLLSWDAALPLPPAAGVHFPERLGGSIAPCRQVLGDAPLTAAAHSLKAAQSALAAGADAVLLSPVFASPSAGQALGAAGFAQMAARVNGPVYALGGIIAANAMALQGSAAGLAVVSGVLAA